MFMEYRMRAFQGMFHVNPDYTHWYGWSEMRRALGDIKEMAETAEKAKQLEDAYADLSSKLTDFETNLSDLNDKFKDLSENSGRSPHR